MTRRRSLRGGFTLVDALVGAALAGIALAGLAAVARLATQSLRLARDTASALALAADQLEALRGGPRAPSRVCRAGAHRATGRPQR